MRHSLVSKLVSVSDYKAHLSMLFSAIETTMRTQEATPTAIYLIKKKEFTELRVNIDALLKTLDNRQMLNHRIKDLANEYTLILQKLFWNLCDDAQLLQKSHFFEECEDKKLVEKVPCVAFFGATAKSVPSIPGKHDAFGDDDSQSFTTQDAFGSDDDFSSDEEETHGFQR